MGGGGGGLIDFAGVFFIRGLLRFLLDWVGFLLGSVFYCVFLFFFTGISQFLLGMSEFDWFLLKFFSMVGLDIYLLCVC